MSRSCGRDLRSRQARPLDILRILCRATFSQTRMCAAISRAGGSPRTATAYIPDRATGPLTPRVKDIVEAIPSKVVSLRSAAAGTELAERKYRRTYWPSGKPSPRRKAPAGPSRTSQRQSNSTEATSARTLFPAGPISLRGLEVSSLSC